MIFIYSNVQEVGEQGNKSSRKFKPTSLPKVAKEIGEKFGLDCQPEHEHNRLCTVKKEWKLIQELRRKSRFGLDDNLKMITFNQKTYDMDGLSFIQGMYFWKSLTIGFNFSKKKKNSFY